jgi:hypothetical protein
MTYREDKYLLRKGGRWNTRSYQHEDCCLIIANPSWANAGDAIAVEMQAIDKNGRTTSKIIHLDTDEVKQLIKDMQSVLERYK